MSSLIQEGLSFVQWSLKIMFLECTLKKFSAKTSHFDNLAELIQRKP